ALGQLVLGWLRPQPQTRPDAPIRHSGVNPFGINTFLEQEVEPAKREQTLRMVRDAGFTWIRQPFPWQDIEIHGKGDFEDRRHMPYRSAWEKYDNIVDLAEKYGLNIIARLDSPPAWSRADGEARGAFAPPDRFEDFGDFVYTIVSRYKGRVRYYQLWNEPNIYPEWGEQDVDPEAYTRLLCIGYRRAKEADPDVVILSGALAQTLELGGRNLSDLVFLQRMYNAGARDCFDILAMQGYGLWSGPTDHRLRPTAINYARQVYARDIMVQNGDAEKPIWLSEMNWNAAPEGVEPRYGRVTLEQQARYAPLAYERARREWPWIGVINFWYFKRPTDEWERERRPEAYFRMVLPDFTPLPVYEAMRAYTQSRPP
ncbi:MAG: hypothetical protein C4309_11955, partial [Chloroflexota bacterium]